MNNILFKKSVKILEAVIVGYPCTYTDIHLRSGLAYANMKKITDQFIEAGFLSKKRGRISIKDERIHYIVHAYWKIGKKGKEEDKNGKKDTAG